MVVHKAQTANGGGDASKGPPPQQPDGPAISTERIISMKRLWDEVDAKRARSLLSGSFFRYLCFVIIYLIALQHQKSAEPTFMLTQALRQHYVEEPFTDVHSQKLRTFEEIANVGDFWMWVEQRFLPATFDLFWSNGDPKTDFFKGAILAGNRVTKGFRITQRRSESGACLLIERYNAFFPFCFPNTDDDGRAGAVSKAPFGPYYNESKYEYSDFGYFGGREDSGFVVNFDFEPASSLKKVQELKNDRFIDEATRWVRVDLTTYNPSSNLFAHIEFLLYLDNTGRVSPKLRVTTMKTEAYLNTVRDYVNIVLEILVMISVVMFAIGDIKDCLILRSNQGGIGSYWSNFWNWIDFLLVLAFATDFTVWILLITDPTRGSLNVKLGPSLTATAGTTTQRDVLKDTMDMFGQSPNLWSIRAKQEVYWVAQSFTLLLVLLRLLRYLAVNSYLGAIMESFVVMKTTLLQFIIIVCAGNTAFAYMGYIMFGQSMVEFHTFDQSFFTLLATSLGDGITYAELA